VQPRAYAPDLDPSQAITTLSAEESAHLVRVLRLGAGARVLVFDGRGAQYLARIATAAKDSVTLSLLEPVPPATEPRVRLTLAQGVLKGDKMDTVIRDATMMGVSAVIPLRTLASHRRRLRQTMRPRHRPRDRPARTADRSVRSTGRTRRAATAAHRTWRGRVRSCGRNGGSAG
jgi:RsmE family RNA methyltransferase